MVYRVTSVSKNTGGLMAASIFTSGIKFLSSYERKIDSRKPRHNCGTKPPKSASIGFVIAAAGIVSAHLPLVGFSWEEDYLRAGI